MTEKSEILTIYTCTYNRGYILSELHDSIIKSSRHPFEWIIVDDGSTDNTKEIVEYWIVHSPINISYHKKNNEGKQKAADVAHKLIQTELHTCVDSDDKITENMIEEIEKIWNAVNKTELYGLVGLDVYENGNPVGTTFRNKPKVAKFNDFLRLGIKGDKKFVLRTDLVQEIGDYPSFGDEKFPAPGYLYRLLDKHKSLYLVNSYWCVVEYLQDGISKNKFRQFINNPNSTYFYRSELYSMSESFINRLKQTIHGSAMLMFGAKPKNAPNLQFRILTLLFFPIGSLLALYLRFNISKGVIK